MGGVSQNSTLEAGQDVLPLDVHEVIHPHVAMATAETGPSQLEARTLASAIHYERCLQFVVGGHLCQPVHVPSSDEGAGCFAVERGNEGALCEQGREADGGRIVQFTPVLHRQSAHHHYSAAWRRKGGGEEKSGGEGRRGEERRGEERR